MVRSLSEAGDRSTVRELTISGKDKIESVGLCATCEKARDCDQRSRRNSSAQYCEDYTPIHPEIGPVSTAPGAQPPITSEPNGHNGVVLGLCANCLHGANCTLPKPPGGVWRCEEYE